MGNLIRPENCKEKEEEFIEITVTVPICRTKLGWEDWTDDELQAWSKYIKEKKYFSHKSKNC
eukprot:gene9625-1829_t